MTFPRLPVRWDARKQSNQKAVEAGSTAEVYDHLARLYRNNAEGVPAPQSEVGFFGSKGDFLRGVADALADSGAFAGGEDGVLLV